MKLNKFPNDRQMDMADCGPACLKMLAKYYGKYYSLQYIRDKCGLTKEGVSFLDISYAAEQLGFRTISIKASIDDLLFKIPLPVIIHWDNSHFIVVHKTSAKNSNSGDLKKLTGTIFVSDPAKGYIQNSVKDFAEKWLTSPDERGVLMVVEPTAEFYDRHENEKQDRKQTLRHFLNYFRLYKNSFYNLGVVMLLVTILQGFLPFISKSVIDVGIQTQDIDFINIVLIANVAIHVSILFSNIVRDWILLHVTSRVNIAIISDYLIKLMLLPISFFENKMTGDILQRAQDHERIRSFIMNNSTIFSRVGTTKHHTLI